MLRNDCEYRVCTLARDWSETDTALVTAITSFTSIIRAVPFRTWALWLGMTMSIAANVLLLRTTHTLATEYEEYRGRDDLKPGCRLPALTGRDVTGAPLSVSYDGVAQSTVLLVFTPTCPYCKENWPAWSRLMSSARPEQTRIVAVDLSGKADAEYLRAQGLANVPVFTTVDYGSGAAYKLQRVPTTLLISAKGTVTQVWRGPLDESELATLERAMQSP